MARQRRRRGGGASRSDSQSSQNSARSGASGGRQRSGERQGRARSDGGDRGGEGDRGRRSHRHRRSRRNEGGQSGQTRYIPTTVLFRNALVVGFDPPSVQRADVLVAQGVVAEVGVNLMAPDDAEVIDGRRRVLMPGLVNAWHEPTAEPLPGFRTALDPKPERGEWLARCAAAHDEASMICTAFTRSLEALRAGTTCLIGVHESPSFITGSIGRLKDVFLTLGLRGVLAYRVGESATPEAHEEALGVTRRSAAFGGGETFRLGVSAHHPNRLDDAALAELVAIAKEHGTPFFTELGQSEDEVEESRKRFNKKTPLERLEAVGALGERTLVRVGYAATDEEVARLRAAGCTLVHTPRADLYAGRGRANAAHFHDGGTLGTGELEPHVFRELRLATDLAIAAGTPLDSSQLIDRIAAGHRLASRMFGLPLGKIETDAIADLVLLEYDPALPLTTETLAQHLVHGLGSARVLKVMVSGRFLYRDGQMTTLDQQTFMETARRGAVDYHERVLGTPYPGVTLAADEEPSAASDEDLEDTESFEGTDHGEDDEDGEDSEDQVTDLHLEEEGDEESPRRARPIRSRRRKALEQAAEEREDDGEDEDEAEHEAKESGEADEEDFDPRADEVDSDPLDEDDEDEDSDDDLDEDDGDEDADDDFDDADEDEDSDDDLDEDGEEDDEEQDGDEGEDSDDDLDDDLDEDGDEGDDEEPEEAPAPKRPARKKATRRKTKASKKEPEEDDDDDDEDAPFGAGIFD